MGRAVLSHPRFKHTGASLGRSVPVWVLAGCLHLSSFARASAQELPDAAPRARLELGLYSARPAALATGLGTGLNLGWQHGDALTVGLQVAWSTATEFALTREVRHDDFRMRARLGIQGGRGRGTAGLRLGVGPTLVAEATTRNQGRRAGLTGDDLETSALRLLPGADLEATVGLRIWEDWGAVIGGGPNLHLLDGAARFGWFGAVSVAWMPR